MSGPWTDAVSERFEGGPETVRAARRFVAESLRSCDPDRAGDAALLTSELATNAVIHAQSSYTVTVRRQGDRIRVEVTDHLPGGARRRRYSSLSGTGRGLGLVEDLSASWGVDDAGAGKVVWFELDDEVPTVSPSAG